MQTSKNTGTAGHNPRGSQLVSGQHSKVSVTSYNTAEFTKFSINQYDILSG